MVVDCFTFFNELKMLEFRLAETFEFVDYYVLVESTKTFTNQDKELYYQNNKHLFEKYRSKIIHVIVDDVDMPEISNGEIDNNWNREKFQRDSIMRGLKKIDLQSDDVILINDVDEIPSCPTLQGFKHEGVQGLYILVFESYLYTLNHKVVHEWPAPRISTGSRAVDYQSLIEMGGPDKVRNTFGYNKDFYPNEKPNESGHGWLLKNAGWHFSYFGGVDLIIKKIKNYSHQEFNTDDIINNIDYYIENGLCVSMDYSTKFIKIEDNPDLPINYKLLL